VVLPSASLTVQSPHLSISVREQAGKEAAAGANSSSLSNSSSSSSSTAAAESDAAFYTKILAITVIGAAAGTLSLSTVVLLLS
jgi:hypothetical protein